MRKLFFVMLFIPVMGWSENTPDNQRYTMSHEDKRLFILDSQTGKLWYVEPIAVPVKDDSAPGVFRVLVSIPYSYNDKYFNSPAEWEKTLKVTGR